MSLGLVGQGITACETQNYLEAQEMENEAMSNIVIRRTRNLGSKYKNLGVAALWMVASFMGVSTTHGHEGHGTEEIGEYDLDAPRTISDQTAKHIGLEVVEVDFGPVEEVLEITGVVKPLPNGQEFIVARVDAQVKKIHIRAGDRVKKGDRIVTLSRADGGSIPVRVENLKEGVVIHLEAKSGQWADKGTVLAEIADYKKIQVEGEVPESLIPLILGADSKKVRIRTSTDPNFVVEGSVRFLAPELDPVKRTAHLIVDAPNPGGVLIGEMWVTLSVVLREAEETLRVPRSAVVVDGPRHFVFVLNGDQYEKQDIVPGITNDQYVEVIDGLAPGDTVVTRGAYSLTQIRPTGGAKEKSED